MRTILKNTLIFIVLSIFSISSAHDCSSVLRIESEGILNYLANVTFNSPVPVNGQWTIDMETDTEFTFLGGWAVWVSSEPSAGRAAFKSRELKNNITEGEEITFRFRISWFKGEPKPKVFSLIFNKSNELCGKSGTNSFNRTPISHISTNEVERNNIDKSKREVIVPSKKSNRRMIRGRVRMDVN